MDDITRWNTSQVANMFGMFNGTSQFNQDLSKWDVSNVIDMERIFSKAGTKKDNTKLKTTLTNWFNKDKFQTELKAKIVPKYNLPNFLKYAGL